MRKKRIIERLDNLYLQDDILKLKGKRGDKVSVIYCDMEPGAVKIRRLGGTCLSLKRKGLNSKLSMLSTIKSVEVRQIFFLNGPTFVDLEFH